LWFFGLSLFCSAFKLFSSVYTINGNSDSENKVGGKSFFSHDWEPLKHLDEPKSSSTSEDGTFLKAQWFDFIAMQKPTTKQRERAEKEEALYPNKQTRMYFFGKAVVI
jgi:hypothetical protein